MNIRVFPLLALSIYAVDSMESHLLYTCGTMKKNITHVVQ